MSSIVPPYAHAVHAVVERFRGLLPRRDLALEIRLRFLDRGRVVLSVMATRGQERREYHHTILEAQYMVLRADALEPALDRAVTRIVEELFPDEAAPQKGFRGVRYWTWSEKRLQEDEPLGK